jgi:short subunit fatty acids transporter
MKISKIVDIFIVCVVVLFISSMIFVGCDDLDTVKVKIVDEQKKDKSKQVEEKKDKYAPQHNIIIIEGCEYIQFSSFGGWSYIHKGNCNNPIHIYNK